MIRLAISGSCGKMGSRILELAVKDKDFKVACALEQKKHSLVGTKISGVIITGDIQNLKDADVLIDFTSPDASIEHLEECLRQKKAIVIGTTGLSLEQQERIMAASKKIPIVFSPNMSVGVNLLFKLVKEAAQRLSSGYKVYINEAHHIHKKDAPSGTAKKLAQIVEDADGQEIQDIKATREGEIVGDHEVIFDSLLDTIKLSHHAKTRDIFAEGALIAAKWITKKKKGLFDMQNILNEK